MLAFGQELLQKRTIHHRACVQWLMPQCPQEPFAAPCSRFSHEHGKIFDRAQERAAASPRESISKQARDMDAKSETEHAARR